MKEKNSRKWLAIVLSTILTSMYILPSYAGIWKYSKGQWFNENLSGALNTGWYSEGIDDWYYLGEDGVMKTGWFESYHLHEISDGTYGRMDYGWYFDGINWFF